MKPLKILLVEDDTDYQNLFKDGVEVFKNQPNNMDVDFEIVEDVYDAVNIINVSYDGVIIDLHLGGNDQGGNEVVQILYNEFTKIPIVFVTAFADSVNNHPSVIKIRRREDGSYHSDLLLFQQIRDIGLTDIIGGRGLIEQQLRDVYLENLLPQIETWISYGEAYKETDPKRTERALLRYTLNHLLQLLEEDEEDYFREEVYLYPSVLDRITTGSIVKIDDQWFVILSPACDLVPRGENGVRNTDYILLAEIESVDKVLAGSKSKGKVRELCTNKRDYYHWLPETDFFEGGILNFRKLKTLNEDDFNEKFGKPTIQISPSFVKDIVSRFSSYYARQGQPDIDSKDFVTRYTT
ncbi:MAG: response regulator [Candidatus Poribacteria bacterium]|nr:response regulator [Candidatus Poribacteria bacterium]